MATNEDNLKRLSSSLENLIRTSKNGSKYVSGGMYGVEQLTKIIESLDTLLTITMTARTDAARQQSTACLSSTQELLRRMTLREVHDEP